MVSIGGIGFAIILMFMQLGFLGSVGDTAVLVYERLPCHLVVRSRDYLHVFDTGTLPVDTTASLEGLEVVRDALPLDISVSRWQNPQNGSYRAIALMGIDLDRPALDLPELKTNAGVRLRSTGHVLVDDASSSDYGPVNGKAFGTQDIGVRTDVGGQEAVVVGTFRMGTGLAANGALLGSRETFTRLMPGSDPDETSLIMLRLKPGIAPEVAKQIVAKRLVQLSGPARHAVVMTLDEVSSAEKSRWYTETPIGMIFGIGVALAVVVGGVISYMILASDVTAHLGEYATLRAMGYSNQYLIRTLLSQASLLALIALPPSTLAALGLYEITSAVAGLPIRMTILWLIIVWTLSVVMCNTAGVLALRKLLQAEPANLF